MSSRSNLRVKGPSPPPPLRCGPTFPREASSHPPDWAQVCLLPPEKYSGPAGIQPFTGHPSSWGALTGNQSSLLVCEGEICKLFLRISPLGNTNLNLTIILSFPSSYPTNLHSIQQSPIWRPKAEKERERRALMLETRERVERAWNPRTLSTFDTFLYGLPLCIPDHVSCFEFLFAP